MRKKHPVQPSQNRAGRVERGFPLPGWEGRGVVSVTKPKGHRPRAFVKRRAAAIAFAVARRQTSAP
jgi:hypothetical protein